MRIGIFSCFYFHNYGSMLQAYATQLLCNKYGESKTFNCAGAMSYMTTPKLKYYFHKLTDLSIVKRKLRTEKSKILIKLDINAMDGIRLRNEKFDSFAETYFDLTDELKNRNAIYDESERYDVVVVGSDMLWNPINIELDYFTLTAVNDRICKISYATSVGTTNIPKYLGKKYSEFLNRFDAISVREISAKKILRNYTSKVIDVVLDPTLMLSSMDWDALCGNRIILEKPYIFCYLLGVNKSHREVVEKIKRITKYEIVTLRHVDEYVKADSDFGDKALYDVGPVEFVSLIKNASIVCTDSFHGTCFSIIYHKEFITFNRFSEKDRKSTNTRIDSLLGQLNLEERRVKTQSDEASLKMILAKKIEYKSVDKKLDTLKKASLDYFERAINNDRDKK